MVVNGHKTAWVMENDFLVIKRMMQRGDVVSVEFTQIVGPASLLYPERTPGFHRYMHGPLVPRNTALGALGAACYQAEGVTLAPLCDLTDRRDTAKGTRSSSIQVLFRD